MVESEVSVVRYNCDGNTNQYSFLFPIVSSSDLAVIIYDTESQYEATLIEGTHYSVVPATGGYDNGGTITIRKWDNDTQSYQPFYFAATVRITLLRAPKSLQLSEYKNNEVLPKKQLENDMDRIYYHLQRLYEKFKHILFSSPSDPTEMELPPAETRANHVLAFDFEGKPVPGNTIVTPVSDYMAGFLQSANWDALEDNGFFEQALTYEKIKEGFSSVDEGYTTNPNGFAPTLSVINTLKTIDLTWDALLLLTNLDHFQVERSELNSSDGFAIIATTPRERTIFIDAPDYNYVDGLPIPKTYWYRIVGETHTGGLTAYSNTIEVTVYPAGLQDIAANTITASHISVASVKEIDTDALDYTDYSALQSQIDNEISTYFYFHTPALDTVPAVNWTAIDKSNNVGDIFYVIEEDINVEGKGDSTISPSSLIAGGDSNVVASDILYGYDSRYFIAALIGSSFRFVHTDSAGYYWTRTNDSQYEAALEVASNAQAAADSKIVSYTQDTAPTGKALGDIWYDTSDQNNPYWWDGLQWKDVKDGSIYDALAEAQSKTTTFSGTKPDSPIEGDLFYNTSLEVYEVYRSGAWEYFDPMNWRTSNTTEIDGSKIKAGSIELSGMTPEMIEIIELVGAGDSSYNPTGIVAGGDSGLTAEDLICGEGSERGTNQWVQVMPLGEIYLHAGHMLDGSVELAKLGTTIIQGGYIKTELIAAGTITADKIAAGTITADKINTTDIFTMSIQSNNFVSGSSGWQIDGDGSVEFNDGTFRGELDAATGSFGSEGSDGSINIDSGKINFTGSTPWGSALTSSIGYSDTSRRLDITTNEGLWIYPSIADTSEFYSITEQQLYYYGASDGSNKANLGKSGWEWKYVYAQSIVLNNMISGRSIVLYPVKFWSTDSQNSLYDQLYGLGVTSNAYYGCSISVTVSGGVINVSYIEKINTYMYLKSDDGSTIVMVRNGSSTNVGKNGVGLFYGQF